MIWRLISKFQDRIDSESLQISFQNPTGTKFNYKAFDIR